MKRRSVLSLMVGSLPLSQAAFAQAGFPNKPIRLIVPFPPGGSVDPIARIVAQKLQEQLGQPVVIENRPGGNTAIAAGFVAKAAPDGYTLLFTEASTHVIHTIQAELPYDSIKDFTPVASISKASHVMVVNPSMPATLAEFIAYAKANPGKLNFASSGIGNANHLSAELFNQAAGIQAVHVPYKGGAAALQDLVAGQVQYMVTVIPSVAGALEANQIRALAYSNPQPDVPGARTFAQYGLKGLDQIEAVNVVLGPPNMPAALVQKLSSEIDKALQTAEAKSVLQKQKQQNAFLPPAQLGERMRADQARFVGVVKSQNIKLTA